MNEEEILRYLGRLTEIAEAQTEFLRSTLRDINALRTQVQEGERAIASVLEVLKNASR